MEGRLEEATKTVTLVAGVSPSRNLVDEHPYVALTTSVDLAWGQLTRRDVNSCGGCGLAHVSTAIAWVHPATIARSLCVQSGATEAMRSRRPALAGALREGASPTSVAERRYRRPSPITASEHRNREIGSFMRREFWRRQ